MQASFSRFATTCFSIVEEELDTSAPMSIVGIAVKAGAFEDFEFSEQRGATLVCNWLPHTQDLLWLGSTRDFMIDETCTMANSEHRNTVDHGVVQWLSLDIYPVADPETSMVHMRGSLRGNLVSSTAIRAPILICILLVAASRI